jgi:hypothetical protein
LRGFFDGFLFGFRDCLMLDFLLDNDFLFGIREEDNFIILVLSCAVGKGTRYVGFRYDYYLGVFVRLL